MKIVRHAESFAYKMFSYAKQSVLIFCFASQRQNRLYPFFSEAEKAFQLKFMRKLSDMMEKFRVENKKGDGMSA